MTASTSTSSSHFTNPDVALVAITQGRSKAVAKKAVLKGQTILESPPAAVVPLPGLDRCSRCLKAQVTIGCEECGIERYCSAACEFLFGRAKVDG